MNKKMKIKTGDIDNNISQTHITAYLDKIRFGLFLALLFILLSEIATYLIVKSKIVDLSIGNTFIKSRWTPNFMYIERYFIVQNVLNWMIFAITLIFYKRVNFTGKKILICTAFIIITTIYSFGHWGYIYLSVIYAIPIIFTCPLGKKYRLITLVISLIMTVIYGFYQNTLIKTGYHILIALVSITVLIATYLISGCIYSAFAKAVSDIEEYSKLSDELYDEIAHDFVTGAFSKAALHKDITENNKFKSIAFIDLDDFKEVNDTMGHSTGDAVLQNLVKCFQKKNEQIYRYGGDEFIVLSKLSVDDLAKKLTSIKKSYTASCINLFNYKSTFSAGVIQFYYTENLSDINTVLEQSDKIMYAAKNNGKDQILVDA